jgi:hypothetical protein
MAMSKPKAKKADQSMARNIKKYDFRSTEQGFECFLVSNQKVVGTVVRTGKGWLATNRYGQQMHFDHELLYGLARMYCYQEKPCGKLQMEMEF